MIPHVAIVGSGPSGFFAAEKLLCSHPSVHVDMYERLPVPFGLARFGVAPDHQKIKLVTQVFEKIASSSRFAFFGNVQIGRDVLVDELLDAYSAVIVATGASNGADLGIAGEELKGILHATQFVNWYNGHPDCADLEIDLTNTRSVAIVGQGNVACDVARILLSPIERLRMTDIASHALEQLSRSKVESIHIVGRRGPAQMKITPAELRELAAIDGCSISTDPSALTLNAESNLEILDPTSPQGKTYKLLSEAVSNGRLSNVEGKTLWFDFLRTPTRARGNQHIRALECKVNALRGAPFAQRAVPTSSTVEIPCDLLIRCVGYRGVEISGVPFDSDTGTIPHREGQVYGLEGNPVRGLYVTGWIKRGPTGIIGTNRVDSSETVMHVLNGLSTRIVSGEIRQQFIASLATRGVSAVSWEAWKTIDQYEKCRGSTSGKVREKITSIEELIRISSGYNDSERIIAEHNF
jgi:NADPH-dependent glutamate synthase beta subunit-like oxidoreductase